MSYLVFRVFSIRAACFTLIAVTALGLIAGCQTAPREYDPLYSALGQRDGISRITAQTLLNVAADDRIKGYFQDTDINRLHGMLTDYICQRAGGPCEYSGDNMVDAHRGLGIDSTAFNALVEDLVHAMDSQRIPTGAQNHLLARLAPTHKDVVGPHPLPAPEIMQLIANHDPMYRYMAVPIE